MFEIINIQKYICELKNDFPKLTQVLDATNDAQMSSRDQADDIGELIESEIFQKFQDDVVSEVLKSKNVSGGCFVQKRPSFRVFTSQSLGTSFHSDSWYGHGRDVLTVWIPLSPVQIGAGLYFVDSDLNVQTIDEFLCGSINLKQFNEALLPDSVHVAPEVGEALVFDSDQIHGSPLNSSLQTRLSLDFRISFGDFGSKSPHLFRRYLDVTSASIREHISEHSLSRVSVMKYINGEFAEDTQLQHIFLNAFAKAFHFDFAAQEAEIENHGQPILKSYLSGAAQFDVLIGFGSVLDLGLSLPQRSTVKYVNAKTGFFEI